MHTLELLRSGQLAGISRLQLACGLTEFPPEIFALADSLEILDLSGNALTALPHDLVRLHKLRIIFCSNNQFTELPAVLGRCPSLQMIGFKANQIRQIACGALPHALRWLILTDNQLQALPDEIGVCHQLQKLMLAGNQLRCLPASLAQCERLELVRVAANQLVEFPQVLLGLPRLSWLAFAGNPFCADDERVGVSSTASASIAWDALELEGVLGEGASGVIHRARLAAQGGHQTVALKLFKGAVTSDGLPHCEMAASVRAGAHPHLIAVRGQVHGHPDGVCGLAMEFMDTHWVALAGPPSLASCTRDIYAPNTQFDVAQALGIALSMARVGAHLYALGLLHGDLYGHNILHTPQGHAVLGDFGAASFYDAAALPQAHALQRIEVRAFACLLQELLAYCPSMADFPAMQDALTTLCERCLSPHSGTRPLFADIERALLTWTVPASPGSVPA